MDSKMESLPTEILCHILSFLDFEPAFPRIVREYPGEIVNGWVRWRLPMPRLNIDNRLKRASLVSRRWRQICFPMLFRHMRWEIPSEGSPQAGLLQFLRGQGGDNMAAIVEGLTVIALENPWGCDIAQPSDRVLQSAKGIWSSVFSIIDPLRVTLVGDPCIIAVLTDLAPIPGAESWMFELSKQIMQLSRPSRYTPPPASASGSSKDTDIFALRPWTEFLLNEGSFLANYTTYEYHEYLPPSLLRRIFSPFSQQPPSAMTAPPTRLPHLERFSYIAIFPTGRHFSRTVIPYFPGAETLYMQVPPQDYDFSSILDSSMLNRLDMNDPWMERGNVAHELKWALFDKDHAAARRWERVRRFETPRDYEGELYVLVSNGITDDFTHDVNYRAWLRRREERHDVLIRGPDMSKAATTETSVNVC